MAEKVLRCPLCGKEYRTVGGIPAHIRLARHLTGMHCIKGEEFQRAMREAERGG